MSLQGYLSYVSGASASYAILFPVLLIGQYLMLRKSKGEGIIRGKAFFLGWQIFAFVLICIFYITDASGILDMGGVNGQIFHPDKINLIPFWRWRQNLDPKGLVLNILLFVPIGILLPLLWQRFQRWYAVVLTGAGLSLLIELSQLFTYRVTDIDDLMMNTLGALVGYISYLVFFKWLRKGFQLKNKEAYGFVTRYQGFCTMVFVYGCHFFLKPVLILFF